MTARSAAAAGSAGLALGGCSGVQSALAPAGDDAAQISDLTLLLAAGGAVIFAIVGMALWLGLRGPASARAMLAAERTVFLAGLVFPVVTLAALLGYGLWLTRSIMAAPAAPAALTVEVTGEQWWWRVGYRLPGGGMVAEANEIRIPVGREVEFVLRSADVIHAFWAPSLGGKLDMVPGRTNRMRLTAERAGIYRGQCAEYCGGPHARMAFEIRALPPEDFDRWLAAGAGSAPSPAGEAERRGSSLFMSAGCGGCHTIRGTQARGTIGPDLTRVGGRRTIAGATLATTPADLARFIAGSDHVKPGNRMPPFGIFSGAELADLSAYLMGLR